MSYKQKIQNEIIKAIESAGVNVQLERPKIKEHGDISTNIAMALAKEQKRNPLDIANELKEKLKKNTGLITSIEIAKPGFINFVVSDLALSESLAEVHELGEYYGIAKEKTREKILIEYVSANPTGDLHIGHGRQAVIGDCLANLMEASGHEVYREFYINDFGEQISILRDSIDAICKKQHGEKVEWKEEYYPEEILLPYIKRVIAEKNISEAVTDLILKVQRELLSSFNVNFDKWFSEKELHLSGKVHHVLEKLKNVTYEEENAVWFKAKEYGDVRDRVLIRADKRPTYLLSDIAYHKDKFDRGFPCLITVWGADHHGQEIGLKGGLKALGFDDKKLEIIFVQLVSLKKEGQEVKMSKRAGTFVTLHEVLKEVGPDAFRYFLIESHPNNRMIFDIDLAKKQDKDNPVYYIQYAHARCCSIFRQITDKKQSENSASSEILLNLFRVNNKEHEATKTLVLRILDFPSEVYLSAASRSPSRIANYLKDLASDLHSFYTICRVLSKETKLTEARLKLVHATKITLANGLKILGIHAPDSM